MYKLTNNDNVEQVCNSKQEFIDLVQGVFHENEDGMDSPLEGKVPQTITECVNYIREYCCDQQLEIIN